MAASTSRRQSADMAPTATISNGALAAASAMARPNSASSQVNGRWGSGCMKPTTPHPAAPMAVAATSRMASWTMARSGFRVAASASQTSVRSAPSTRAST